jgi:hypothetical protein
MARAVQVLLATALLLGCGGESAEPPVEPSIQVRPAAPDARAPAAAATPQRKPRRRGIRIKAIDSQFGAIVGDGRGQAVYLFDRDNMTKSECYGDCARAWPPVLTGGVRSPAGASTGACSGRPSAATASGR